MDESIGDKSGKLAPEAIVLYQVKLFSLLHPTINRF